MKNLLSILIYLALSISVYGQDMPVEIKTGLKKVSELEYDVIFKIKIEPDWHLYSQHNPEGASNPIKITSTDTNSFLLIGSARESKTYKAFNDIWKVEEIFFKRKAKLRQRIQILDLSVNKITINFKGQVCSEFCTNIDEDFTMSLKGEKIKQDTHIDDRSAKLSNSLKLNLKNTDLLFKNSIFKKKKGKGLGAKKKSYLSIFILGFFGGLLAFLTPCVFPLVPLTVSFFTKQSEKKSRGFFNATLYGFFILAIYLLLSVPFHIFDSLNPEILTTISTNVWLNLFFFISLLFFAGSFFGFYEITLPNSWGNKMDSASNIGGIIGIFFMALTLAIVSFSCTGPILGSLLAGSLREGAWPLSVGMGGFGLALALPFALFALFPSLLKSLPKSGGWMNTIKIILGFLEIALAFKFLSSADLVGHWGVLYREIFIFIWLIILILSILFLLGKLRFDKTMVIKRVSGIRVVLSIFTFAFFIYLLPGLMSNPTWNQNILSGIAPPEYHSVYTINSKKHCPLNLNCFKNFEEGMAYAKKQNKPVLLDFTGFACVNCRQMEETVWRDETIYKIMQNEIVLISLYVDDHSNPLPKKEQFDYIKSNGKKKKITTYGGKWATMQAENFKTASQPYYVLLSPEMKVLNTPQQYCSTEKYLNWLKVGLKNFKK